MIRGLYLNDMLIDTLAKQMSLSKSYMYKLLGRAMDNLLSVYNSRCETRPYARAERLIRDVTPYMPEGSIA